MPVVLNFHGFTSDEKQQQLLSGMNTKSDVAGFIAVHPRGTGVPLSWNAGACCGQASMEGVDDVRFVREMLDRLETELCVDGKRVYATGMSNGGFLSHRLACELSDRIAAVAPVAGVLGVSRCTPPRAVPVMQFHGTLDPLVPYNGEPVKGFPSVATTIDGWAARNACSPEVIESYRKVDTHCATHNKCPGDATVTLCTVDGGGHTWPGGLPVPSLGHTTSYLSATDAMWEFFASHPMH
jgi:polyhydroxybutyrate depolymerase